MASFRHGVPLLLLLLLVGLSGWAVAGSHSAFTAQTRSEANGLTTGTVTVADDDGDGALYELTGLEPGDREASCVEVTYTGSLPADVALHAEGATGAAAAHLRLRVEAGRRPGGASTPSCTGFAPDAERFEGTLASFQSGYAAGSGLTAVPFGKTRWDTDDHVVYRLTISLPATAPAAAQGTGTGAHSFVWRAQQR